jgi:hypothetical protein
VLRRQPRTAADIGAQFIWARADTAPGSAPLLTGAGTTKRRWRASGANRPWKRTRWVRGRGTSAARRAMKSKGSTKSPGAISNRRRRARMSKGRMPGVTGRGWSHRERGARARRPPGRRRRGRDAPARWQGAPHGGTGARARLALVGPARERGIDREAVRSAREGLRVLRSLEGGSRGVQAKGLAPRDGGPTAPRHHGTTAMR